MRILVTNDDGIESEGVQVLARALHDAGYDVLLVAPSRDWSGASASIGSFRPDMSLDTTSVSIDGADLEAWSIAGPPALAVMASRLGAFGEPPGLVVSGINPGLNTGRAVLHSGTVGAVLTGQNFGISGLAVSVDPSDPCRWDTAAQVAVECLPLVIDGPARCALNLNVPARSRDEIEGIRWARLATFGSLRATLSPAADGDVQLELQPTGITHGPDTDQGAVEAGWASLTTLVGVVEAWPDEGGLTEVEGPDLVPAIVPGAELHEVHSVPDASEHRFLRRPQLGEP